MKLGTFARLVFPLLGLASLLACNIGAASPTAVPTQPPQATAQPALETATVESPTAQAPATNSVQGACANPLYPVINGATWTYSGTGGSAGAYSYVDTITGVRSDGFTLTSVFDTDRTYPQEWACKTEGLVPLQLPGATAAVTTQQFSAQFETSNVQGVLLPATVSPGDQWTFSLTLKGTAEISGATAQATGDASYDFKAIGMESVTIPAGAFDAMKIDGVLTLSLTATVAGLPIPIKIAINTTSWYAPSVGLVKTVSTGDVIGTPINDTLELHSYNIP
jgi:hypothetical protein